MAPSAVSNYRSALLYVVLEGIDGVDVAIRSEVDAAEEKVLAWASLKLS